MIPGSTLSCIAPSEHNLAAIRRRGEASFFIPALKKKKKREKTCHKHTQQRRGNRDVSMETGM